MTKPIPRAALKALVDKYLSAPPETTPLTSYLLDAEPPRDSAGLSPLAAATGSVSRSASRQKMLSVVAEAPSPSGPPPDDDGRG
jgi:hypothetical protein